MRFLKFCSVLHIMVVVLMFGNCELMGLTKVPLDYGVNKSSS